MNSKLSYKRTTNKVEDTVHRISVTFEIPLTNLLAII
jgi:hypothetical protein